MNLKRFLSVARLPLILGAALVSTFSGCVGYVDGPRAGVETEVIVQDDYDYYPGYEVYYSRSRHQYAYQDNGAWVYRSYPRDVSVNVLLASPSVHAGFRDAPASHHSAMVRQYPRNWSPQGRVQTQSKPQRYEAGKNNSPKQNNRDDRKKDDRN
jgi:hypothetical protein